MSEKNKNNDAPASSGNEGHSTLPVDIMPADFTPNEPLAADQLLQDEPLLHGVTLVQAATLLRTIRASRASKTL